MAPQRSASVAKGWMRVKTTYSTGSAPKDRRKRLTIAQVLNLVRRLVIVAAAVVFMHTEFAATAKAVVVLRSEAMPMREYANYKSNLIGKYLGSGAIRDSPLVLDVLGNDTSPRNASIYLSSESGAEFEQCQFAKDANLYVDITLRKSFAGFILTSSYNLTFLNDVELIAPIVDCSFEGMVEGDISLVRIYNLVRKVSDPNDVFIIALALSLQEYKILEQSRYGPAFVGVVTVVRDLRATSVENHVFLTLDYPFAEAPVFYVCERFGLSSGGYQVLRTIPRDTVTDPAITLLTARRRGFYFHGESDQANIGTMARRLETVDPLISLTTMEWIGKPDIADSWAWVHGIHFYFAMQSLFSTAVLAVIILRNWQNGKMWVGDAFAALSNGTLISRLVLVAISWHVNQYWVLTEFSLVNGSVLSGSHTVPFHNEFVTADMLVIMLGLMSLAGWASKERVDPAFAMILFMVIHSYRVNVIRLVPSIAKYLAQYADAEYFSGIKEFPAIEAKKTSLRLWTTHRLLTVDFEFLAKSFFPKFVILILVVCYVGVRKIYHQFYPDQVLRMTTSTTKSSSERDYELVEKQHVTDFEIATGALLRSRFGLISDYNNYYIIKGLRYASADGIYCSGYIIANGKFLVATDDIFAIALMKLLRSRLYNVYVYDVDGNSVQQTARLVYPDTLSWRDLTRLNTSILS